MDNKPTTDLPNAGRENGVPPQAPGSAPFSHTETERRLGSEFWDAATNLYEVLERMAHHPDQIASATRQFLLAGRRLRREFEKEGRPHDGE